MSALRKAGVWLGLIEDDEDGYGYGYDDRSYDEDFPDDEFADTGSVVRTRVADRLAGQRAERNSVERPGADRHSADRHSADRHTDRNGADRGYGSDEEFAGRNSVNERPDRHVTERASAERMPAETPDPARLSSVRQLGRPATPDSAAVRLRGDSSYPTQDNLALAPEPRPEVKAAPRPAPVVDERRYQITTLHPLTFNDARTIGENFRDGVPVILNLTEMGEADAKRLVDFAAGLAFGLRGTMERVTNRVFLLSPANIQVTAEDKAKIAEGGFFYQ